MSTHLTKQDLRTIHSSLARLQPPGHLPKTAEELVEIDRVKTIIERMIVEHRPVMQRGKKVFEWRLPRARAPRLNEFAYLKIWMKERLRKELDDEARKLMAEWPDADLHGAQKQRWARVTRFSRNKVDDLGVDVLGGKMPIDSLVRVGVLHDDSQNYLVREGLCMSTSHGNTHVLVEIFEVAEEGVPCEGPKDARVEQVVRKRGKMTRHVLTADSPKPAKKVRKR